MKHQLTELEKAQNPHLEAAAGDWVDLKDIIYLVIPNDSTIGSKAEAVIAQANPSHYENNKINVVDGTEVVRTYSGDKDGLNWKKYAELYADANGYDLAPYSATIAEKVGVQADREAEAEERRVIEEAKAKDAKPIRRRRSAAPKAKRAVRKARAK